MRNLKFSPKGDLLVSSNGGIKIWDISDLSSAELAKRINTIRRGLGRIIFESSFSPDGKLLAGSSNDGIIGVWNIEDPYDPKLLSSLRISKSREYRDIVAITSVNFVSNSILIAGLEDGKIVILDLSDHDDIKLIKEVQAYRSNFDRIIAIKVHNNIAVTALRQSKAPIIIRDLSDYLSIRPIGNIKAGGWINDIALSPDGNLLAITMERDFNYIKPKHIAKVYRIDTLELIGELELPRYSIAARVAFYDNETVFISLDYGRIYTRNIRTFKFDELQLEEEISPNVLVIDVCRNRNILATSSSSGKIGLRNLSNLDYITKLEWSRSFRKYRNINEVGFSPDEKEVAFIPYPKDETFEIFVFDITDPKYPRLLEKKIVKNEYYFYYDLYDQPLIDLGFRKSKKYKAKKFAHWVAIYKDSKPITILHARPEVLGYRLTGGENRLAQSMYLRPSITYYLALEIPQSYSDENYDDLEDLINEFINSPIKSLREASSRGILEKFVEELEKQGLIEEKENNYVVIPLAERLEGEIVSIEIDAKDLVEEMSRFFVDFEFLN